MSRIPQNFLDDLINRVDIVDIVDQRVKLKRSGKNYSACCPFHDEKTPSFTVSPDKQFYYCFGCGASGTALSFIMDYDRVGFVDAVESLAKVAGVEVPREDRQYDDKKDRYRKQCYEMLQQASDNFEEHLKSHPHRTHAVKYLQGRGLSGQIAKIYAMGYAPPGWDNLLLKLGTDDERTKQLVDTGLVIEKPEENKRYDRFRNRIMFPIRDVRGRTLGFGGRVLGDDKPKYLNSPETEVFSKGKELYGLYEAKQQNRKLEQLIVVEGYMDVIALAQYGLWTAVATLGTACGEDHLKLAFKHVNEVVFCFDGDNAGRTAAKRALLSSLSSMTDGRQIRFLFLPEGHDPDSLIRQIGQERFQEQLKRATPLENFLFDVAAENTDLNSMDGRARFSKTAAPLIHQLPEGVFRSLMLDNLAKRTGLSKEVLAEFIQPPEDIAPEVVREIDYEDNGEAPPASGDMAENYLADAYDIDSTDASEAVPRQSQLKTAAIFHENAAQLSNTAPQTKQELPPAKRALILLLDQPQLLIDCETALNSDNATKNEDIQNLIDLVEYLKQRPDATFTNIIGFWGGTKGIDAQQKLASLIAKHIFQNLKGIESYDPLEELGACFTELNRTNQKLNSKDELAKLKNKGLDKLSDEEKRRYQELILSI